MGQKLEIIVHFDTLEQELQGSIDIPMQGAKGLKLKNILYDHPKISFELETPQAVAKFEGVVEEDEIKGDFEQWGVKGTFSLIKSKEQEKTKQEELRTKELLPYDEEEITFNNGEIKFSGSLLLPKKKGKHPAVIMITGSGPQNRYEELFGWKIFQDIASHFTQRGIAVLLYDDRGVGGSSGNVSEATTEDFATDALAALRYLQTRTEIKPQKIGLCGHSEGGIVAPLAASKSEEVAFIICISGTGHSGLEVLLKQSELIARAENIPEEKIRENLNQIRTIVSMIKEEKDPETIKEDLKKIAQTQISSLPEEQKKEIKDMETFTKNVMEGIYRQYSSRWFKFFLEYDPLPVMEKVKCPVLLLFGELDLQVPAEWNKEAMVSALKKGGNKNFKVKIFPKANHLYQEAVTGSPSEYTKLPKEFVPGFLEFMSDWILEQVED